MLFRAFSDQKLRSSVARLAGFSFGSFCAGLMVDGTSFSTLGTGSLSFGVTGAGSEIDSFSVNVGVAARSFCTLGSLSALLSE